MTREEEIRKAGIEYTMEHNPMCVGGEAFADIVEEMNRSYSFEAGAKWADETMIDKACEWLSLNLKDIVYFGLNGNIHKPELIKNFKSAMKESHRTP